MNRRPGRSSRITHRSSPPGRLSSIAVVLLFLSCTSRESPTTTDDLGRPVALPREIRRVVTLAPNVTEMMFAIGAGDRVAGTDEHSNHPTAALKLPKVGGMQPNLEKIVSLDPDVVFASSEGNHPNLAPALAAADIPLYVIRTDRLAEIAPAMRRLGEMLDTPGADAAASALETAIASQKRARTNAPRILFAVWTDPLYVAGRSTFTDDLFILTGARNAVETGGWPQYSLESLVARPPDLLLYPQGSVTPQQVDALLKRASGLRVRAVAVDQDVFQRPGPRVAEAARALNAILDGQ